MGKTGRVFKPVYRFNLDKELVNHYKHCDDAAEKNHCKSWAIVDAIRKRTVLNGYYYGYEEVFYSRILAF